MTKLLELSTNLDMSLNKKQALGGRALQVCGKVPLHIKLQNNRIVPQERLPDMEVEKRSQKIPSDELEQESLQASEDNF